MIAHRILDGLQRLLGKLPENSHLWSFTIRGFDGSDYLTRALFPRVAGRRVVLHQIHREDFDPHCHDHPWRTAKFLILSGGYVEERLHVSRDGFRTIEPRTLNPGDVNELDAGTFHRVATVEPNTYTLGLLGDRCQDWGYLVDGVKVPHEEYFARMGYRAKAPGRS